MLKFRFILSLIAMLACNNVFSAAENSIWRQDDDNATSLSSAARYILSPTGLPKTSIDVQVLIYQGDDCTSPKAISTITDKFTFVPGHHVRADGSSVYKLVNAVVDPALVKSIRLVPRYAGAPIFFLTLCFNEICDNTTKTCTYSGPARDNDVVDS